MIVMKFGGTSVQDAAAMREVEALAREARDRAPLVVLSATAFFPEEGGQADAGLPVAPGRGPPVPEGRQAVGSDRALARLMAPGPFPKGFRVLRGWRPERSSGSGSAFVLPLSSHLRHAPASIREGACQGAGAFSPTTGRPGHGPWPPR